jgi:hypothetical protein
MTSARSPWCFPNDETVTLTTIESGFLSCGWRCRDPGAGIGPPEFPLPPHAERTAAQRNSPTRTNPIHRIDVAAPKNRKRREDST